MKKILFISHYSGLLGSNLSLESIVLYFKEKGMDVSVLLPSKGAFYSRLKGKNINVIRSNFFYYAFYIKYNIKYFSLPLLWLYNLIALPFLILKIWNAKPDLIYVNSSVAIVCILISKYFERNALFMYVNSWMKTSGRILYLDTA